MAKQSWLTGHADAARRAVASLVGAEQWAMKSVNRDEVLAVVAQAVPGLADQTAVEAVTEALFGPASEYQPDGRLSLEGINAVVGLYNASRGRNRTVESVTDMIDYSYLSDRDRNRLPPSRGGDPSRHAGTIAGPRSANSVHGVDGLTYGCGHRPDDFTPASPG